MTKKELAKAAKGAGEIHFYADCKKHGKGVKHQVCSMRCCLCLAECKKNYRQENKEAISEQQKSYYEQNKEAILEYRKSYYQQNREAISGYDKNYRQENKEAISERMKKYHKKNAAYIFARRTLSRLDNDQQEVFSGITKAEAESLCGYSQVEFILHIESTFKDGMSWENRSEWHIDHVLPVAWFKEQGICDVRLINSLNNLEAMPAKENQSKGAMFMGNSISEQSYFDWLQISEGVDWSDVKKAG